MGAPSSNKPATATLPSSFTTTTTNFHNTTPATTPSTTKQPRLRASCDGCFLAKVKCTKSRPVCSRCLAVGLVCKYSPSSRSLGGTNRSHDKDTGRSDKRKTRVRRHGGTAVLASTMSEESCAWLAQHAQQWAGPANPHSSSTGYGKGAVNEGYDWDPWLSSVSIVDQGYNGPLSSGSDWLTPESQGWIQFAHPTFGSGMGGEVCWQTMREVNSPFSIGSDEVEEGVGGGFVVNQGQWVG